MSARKARVFKWSQRKSWERVFRNLLADKINDAVIAEVRRINPRCAAGDSFEWLNSVVATFTKQPENVPAILAQRLADYYKFIIAFHGTRSNSAADFIEQGIRRADIDVLNLQAEEIFGKSDGLQNAISELHFCKSHDHGKVFLSLTKNACLKDHPHYMQHGSEHLAGIAIRLGQITKLEARGKPLIVECLIPTNILESESAFWNGRSYAMLGDFFARLLHPERRQLQPSCAVTVQPIHAENILCVHEFAEIKRRFKWNDFNTNEIRRGEEILFRPLKIWAGKAKV